MALKLVEGETLLLPCMTCCKLNIRAVIRVSSEPIICADCSQITWIAFEHREEGWTIRIRPAVGETSVWE